MEGSRIQTAPRMQTAQVHRVVAAKKAVRRQISSKSFFLGHGSLALKAGRNSSSRCLMACARRCGFDYFCPNQYFGYMAMFAFSLGACQRCLILCCGENLSPRSEKKPVLLRAFAPFLPCSRVHGFQSAYYRWRGVCVVLDSSGCKT